MTLPLEGLRILDLSRLLPGPYCTLLLADLGAAVVKIEDPQGGDYVRQMPPQLGEEGSALFHALNRNKKSVALDLRTPAGREALLDLAAGADVLVESFRPGVLDRLGLSFDTLVERNSRLILCSISGFGQSGPDRDRAGHDIGYAARAGILGFAGEPHGRSESWPGVQIADVAGGSLSAAVAILAALRERDRTGRGRHLDVAMTDGALALLHLHLATTWGGGGPLQRGTGPLNGGYPCYGLYRTKDDRQMALGALEPKFWLAFCAAVEREDLGVRGYDREARGAVEALFASRPFEEWLALARATDCCLEPVWEGDEVEADPHHRARGLFFDLPDPRLPGGSLRSLRTPVRIGEPPLQPAPFLGADTRAELEAAGVSAATVDAVLALLR
ncbi:CaiB/BaiF CoA transferase family protein [Vulgatibacter sp.]|uniref:CaiB/BaiF CoA transferase family protein n=1 Tax=Vulgatibacter sp. TaxID=1971226 RepID=UPI003564AB70